MLNTQLQNIAVMSLQTGTSLGTITEPIIDPRTLKIMAFYVVGPHIQETSVLHTSDIRELGPLGLIVDGADSIMPADEDLIRLQEVINFHFSLLGKPVVDDRKHRLGKVTEYITETGSYTIQKLHVSQSLMKNLKSTNLIIHRSQIVELNDYHIVVRSAAMQDQMGLVQALNPFRKATQLGPSPEATEKH